MARPQSFLSGLTRLHLLPAPADTDRMRSRLAVLLIVGAASFALPAAALAGVQRNKVLRTHQGSALAEVQSMSSVPLGWHSSAGQAVAALERTPTLVALHRRMHPLHVYPYVWRSEHPYWYVMFLYRGKIVASANVSPAGRVDGVWTGAQAAAPYTHGHVPGVLTSWMILLPAALLFMLPFFDPRRLRRIAHLDGLVVLAFLISYLLLAGAHLESAVWLAYPPLLYLLVRMLRRGVSPHPGRDPARPLIEPACALQLVCHSSSRRGSFCPSSAIRRSTSARSP